MDLIQLSNSLKSKQNELQQILPKQLPVEKFVRIAITEFRNNPKLLACNPETVYSSLLQCAELGLMPSKTTGHCYLVPYKSDCTVQIGYRGLIDIVIRSGHVKNIRAVPVKFKDLFEVTQGTQASLRHIPNYDLDNNEYKAFYAVATLEDGTQQFEVMSLKEVEDIKKLSRGSSIWANHYGEMAKKTVVRRLIKYLPMSPKLELALSLDNEIK